MEIDQQLNLQLFLKNLFYEDFNKLRNKAKNFNIKKH